MKMPSKKVLTICLCLCILLVVSATTFRRGTESTLPPKVLVTTDTYTVDGVSVQFDWYNDRGVMVQTAAYVDASGGKTLPIDILIAAAEEQASEYLGIDTAGTTTYQEQSNATADCYVRHGGVWQTEGGMPPFSIGSKGMSVNGFWDGSGVAKNIRLSQTIEANGIAVSITAPIGFSVLVNSNTCTWVSADYKNVSLATAYTGDYKATSILPTLGVTVKSGSEIIPTGATLYTSGVSSEHQILLGK